MYKNIVNIVTDAENIKWNSKKTLILQHFLNVDFEKKRDNILKI